MSYCRFSSMDFGCDVYLFDHVDGYFALHVAARRVVGDVPPLPDILKVGAEEFMVAYRAQSAFLDDAQREKIDHPDAGESFYIYDEDGVIEKLRELKAAGFRFPDHVIPMLEEERDERRAAAEQRNLGPDHEEPQAPAA